MSYVTCQSFRSSSDGLITEIDAIWDSNANCYVVLWSRIQFAFENLRSVKLNNKIVSFMVNDAFEEVLPYRIPCYPGAVLDVIQTAESISSQVSGLSIADRVSLSQSPLLSRTDTSSSTTVSSPSTELIAIPGPNTAVGRLVRLAVTKGQDSNRGTSGEGSHSTTLPTFITSAVKSSLESSGKLYDSFLVSMKTGQLEQAEALKAEFRQHFGVLQNEMGENRGLQEEMKQMMTTMMELQRQANERLISIQRGIRAILTQTYELLEYPIPRLFIVLPKESSRLDILNPFTDKFRLFFLCECGEHTKTTNSRIPHHIHMAKHEGYDLDRPNEFFQKYGNYILGMLRMIKHGVAIAGYVVPPLAHLKLADGLDRIQKGLESIETNLEPHVDSAIAYLEKIQGSCADAPDGQDQVTQAQALEGAELRQVANFLKNRDEAMVLGNLYRISTNEGHIKWVCLDHYRENYNELALQAFTENVHLNGGKYDENTGTVTITLKSASLAREFYGLLVKARNIQELTLTLGWDWTYGDLKTLRDSLQTLNVAKISVDCQNHTGPTSDSLNRGKRYDPLAHIMMNTKIQSAEILKADIFFSRTSTFPKKPTPLREVTIESMFSPKSHGKNLQILLDQSPHLKTLSLGCASEDFYETVELVRTATACHNGFQTLTVKSNLFQTTLTSDSLRAFTLSSKLSRSYKSDFRATVLATLGSHLDMYCIDDATTDLDFELLLAAAATEGEGGCRLKVLQFKVGTATFSSLELGKNPQMHLKRLLQFHLPKDCVVRFNIENFIQSWCGGMAWFPSQCNSIEADIYDNASLESLCTAVVTNNQERSTAQVGDLGKDGMSGRWQYSWLQRLCIFERDWTWEPKKMEILVRLVRAIPDLKEFRLMVISVNKTFDPKELMPSFNYSSLEVLHFQFMSWTTAHVDHYRAVVESVPTAIESSPLRKLILGCNDWDKSSQGEHMAQYTKVMAGKIPGCIVDFYETSWQS